MNFGRCILATLPLQILLGPHPALLIVNCIREFVMMGFLGPAVTVAMMSLVLGQARTCRALLVRFSLFGLGLRAGRAVRDREREGRSAAASQLFMCGPLGLGVRRRLVSFET